jgi:ATP-binding cassette, subfamily B, bacterial
MQPGARFGIAPAAGAGLPFGGIPPEYAEQIGTLLRDEPQPAAPEVRFDHATVPDAPPFSLWLMLRPHLGALLVALLLVAAEQIAFQIGPLLFGFGIDHGVRERDLSVLLAVVGAYLLSIVVHMGFSAARTAWTGRLGLDLMYELRVRVFTHLQRLGLDFYTREKGGRVMTRMTSDIEALATLFNEGVVNLVVQVLTLVVVVGILFWRNAQLTMILLVTIVPVMLGMTLWFRSRSSRAYDRVRERIADVLSDVQESLAGVRVVAMHNRQRYNAMRHRNVLGTHMDANLEAARVAAVYGPGTSAVDIGAQTLVLAIGGAMVFRGELSPGDLAAFVLYIGTFFGPIQELVQLYNTYQSGGAAIRKLRELFALQPSVPDRDDAYPLPPARGAIELRGVTFGYGGALPVLRNVDLVIPEGTTFALVGATGAGKSTLAKLLTRFYDPQFGTVRIDGHDLQGVQIDSLRRQIGVVPQEPFLFAGTIRDNIAFARPDASDAQVLAACDAVGIRELIDRLPDGIRTACHERGVTLSSGERQLIALARAFLAEPRVLVLDEATSNLDLRTESLVERALDVLLEGRTAILIAHRLSTARRAQQIGVLEGGEIVELGRHDELMALGGRYTAMFRTWSQQGGASA